MNAKEYLCKAEKPRIVAIDSDGNEVPMSFKGNERPGLANLRKICAREVSFGKATFVDTFEVTIPKTCRVCKALLYYEDTMVGMREFPDILMCAGDGLIIKFALIIVVDSSQVELNL